jgi:zinc protease
MILTKQSPVERRQLANGLTDITERRGLGPVVFSGIVYRVGSRDEQPGITGLSHLLEHLMFKGTQRFKKGDVAALVERNGGDLNAFTSEDVTMYYEVFSRDRWKLALEIEAERMQNLRIDPDELEAERQVILEERAMYLDIPQIELGEELVAATFRESPYRWPIIGWEADIQAITRDDLLRHYERFYAPGNAALVVVGDVDGEEVFTEAERYFGEIPNGPPIERRIPREPELRSATRVELRRPGNLAHFQVIVRAPEIRTRDSEALALLANLLSGTRTSRLDLALLETGKASDIQVHFQPKSDPSSFGVGVEVQPGTSIAEIEELVWGELNALVEGPIHDEEMERALNQLEAGQLFSMQSPSNRGFLLGWNEAMGDLSYADAVVDNLKSLTKEELQDTAARTFLREKSGSGILIPQSMQPAEEA